MAAGGRVAVIAVALRTVRLLLREISPSETKKLFFASRASVPAARDRQPKRSSYLSLPINDPLHRCKLPGYVAQPQESKLYLRSGHRIISVGLQSHFLNYDTRSTMWTNAFYIPIRSVYPRIVSCKRINENFADVYRVFRVFLSKPRAKAGCNGRFTSCLLRSYESNMERGVVGYSWLMVASRSVAVIHARLEKVGYRESDLPRFCLTLKALDS